MKLYLASEGIPKHLGSAFLDLVGKKAHEIKFAYITNAADPYPLERQGYVDVVRAQFKDLGLNTDEIDLKKFYDSNTLYDRLQNFDVIWCGGGNTWYLRYLVRKSGFEIVIKQLINQGKIYGGDSAGAMIMTPTLRHIDSIDDPNDAPEIVEEGLGIVNFCIVPHWGYEGYGTKLREVKKLLIKDGFEVKTITNAQAIIVKDDETKIVGS